MYCPKCGKENSDNAQFCQSCGQSFSSGQATGQGQPPVQQPAAQGQVARVPNYLVWAIISIFLFWPTAIAAIVYASRVDGLVAAGDIEGAQEASRKAKSWSLTSTIIAVVVFVFYLIVFVAAM